MKNKVVAFVIVLVLLVFLWAVYMKSYNSGQYCFIDSDGNNITSKGYEKYLGHLSIDGKDYYILSSSNRFSPKSIFYKEMFFLFNPKGEVLLKGALDKSEDLYINSEASLLIYKGKKIFVDPEGKVTYYSSDDKTIIDGTNYYGIFPFYYSNQNNHEQLYGYVNIEDQVVVEPQFLYAEPYDRNGLAIVMTEDKKMGCIDVEGNVVIPTIYDYVSCFSDGVALVNADDKWFYIDTSGKAVLEKKGDDFHEGFARIYNDEGKYAYINKNGELLTDYIFDFAYDFANGYAMVNVGGFFGYIDSTGEYIIEPQYTDAHSFSANGLAAVMGDNGLFGYINSSNEWVVEPKYISACSFYDGVALVKVAEE